MSEYLFVGGPLNGERKDTEGQKTVEVGIPDQIRFRSDDELDLISTSRVFFYTLRKWDCGGRYVDLYVLDGMSDYMAMNLLLNGYKL